MQSPSLKNNKIKWLNLFFAAILAVSLASTTETFALSGSLNLKMPLKDIRKARVLHSKAKRSSANAVSFGSGMYGYGLRSGSLDLKTSVKAYLNDLGLPAGLHVRSDNNALGLRDVNQESFRFYYQGHRLCDVSVKSSKTRNQDAFISGIIPEIQTQNSFSVQDWPAQHMASHLIFNSIEDMGIVIRESATHSMEKCLYIHADGSLSPVWESIVEANGLPYLAYADDREIHRIQQRYFGAIGMTKVYKKNKVDGEFGFVTIGNFLGDGTMSTETFEVNPGISVQKANSCTHEFLYEPTQLEFAEASAVTHSTRMLAWYNESFGYEWGDQKPMLIRLREVISDDTNNALYVPPVTSTAQPKILIGEGDGEILQNLMTDADVVSHEFGHHIVFRSITSIKDESLVLHEGLADFFTFARTGDPCLGESICPEGSPICWVEAQCLRTADNDFPITKEFGGAHLKGQVISGMLWDLYNHKDFDSGALTQTVYKAIDYLSESSSYEEFLNSLVQADVDLNGGKHCELIKTEAKNREFDDYADEISCPSSLLAVNDEAIEADPSYIISVEDSRGETALTLVENCGSGTRSKKKSEGLDLGNCGVVGTPVSGLSNLWFLMLIFSPLFGVWLRRRSR